MKIKVIEKAELIGYDVVKKVRLFECDVSEFTFRECIKSIQKDGYEYEDVSYNDGVKVVKEVNGEVEYIFLHT